MPQPLPMAPGDIAAFILPDDCVRKDLPVSDFSGPMALDEQRFEFDLRGNMTDSKLLRADGIIPYRAISHFGGPGQSISDVYNEVASNPDFYWQQVPWGQFGQLDKNIPAGIWQFTQFAPVPPFFDTNQSPYLVSYSAWAQSGASFAPAAWDNGIVFYQFICPQIWTPRGYQVWSVTGRWFYNTLTHPDTGTFPVPFPWSYSTDFALVTSGTLNPGQTIVVGPNDFEPSGNVQSPPAPGGNLATSDGDGWARGHYLVFT